MLSVKREEIDRLKQENAKLREVLTNTKAIILGLRPGHRSPSVMCWCPAYRDITQVGHELVCVNAKAALCEEKKDGSKAD